MPLAKTHANDFRKVVSDPLYQATFPAMRVSRDTDSEIHTKLSSRWPGKVFCIHRRSTSSSQSLRSNAASLRFSVGTAAADSRRKKKRITAEYALMVQNVVVTLINLFGTYRWLIWKRKV
jgi:hypothetical protein